MNFNTSQPHYEALRRVVAEHTTSLVFWVGAGLSMPSGLPDWTGLRERLCGEGERLASAMGQPSSSPAHCDYSAIRSERNLWVAFERLRSALGFTTYRKLIRDALEPANMCAIPISYQLIWRLEPKGLLSTNIDRLAERAYSETFAKRRLTRFNGKEIGRYTHVLKQPSSFLANLHGTWDNSDSWIFTHPELKTLKTSERAYRTFIESCLTTHTVVFLGLTADDESTGGFLHSLTTAGLDCGDHYWITDRKDAKSVEWSDAAGILPIYYDSIDGHELPIRQALEDLCKYVSTDEGEPPPLVPEMDRASSTTTLPPEDELLANPDDDAIRRILNAEAKRILASCDPNVRAQYRSFLEKYERAVYRAWFVSASNGRNQLLGYTIEQEIAQGAFGRVFKARDSHGGSVAIKVLLDDIRRNDKLLENFRRGVQSMRILDAHRVDGMVPYKQSFEIPAFVVMDWVEGPNLDDLVSAHQIDSWDMLLRIASDLGTIISNGHRLPERVLHRDLRPSNIMLEGFYDRHKDWKLVVLDFDLSWHKDALAQSVLPNNAVAGYLAPEQAIPCNRVSTRHSAVDSFGFGMTMYYALAGSAPHPGLHRQPDWLAQLHRAALAFDHSPWKSLPYRFARLIYNCTHDNQAERWDFPLVLAEVNRLRHLDSETTGVPYADVLAEEVFIRWRSPESSSYWDPDTFTASATLPSGLEIQLVGDGGKRQLELHVQWSSRGNEHRRKITRYLPTAVSKCLSVLEKRGWRVESTKDQQSFSIHASRGLPYDQKELDAYADVLCSIEAAITF